MISCHLADNRENIWCVIFWIAGILSHRIMEKLTPLLYHFESNEKCIEEWLWLGMFGKRHARSDFKRYCFN